MGSNKMAKHKNVTPDSLEDKISKLSNILHDIKALGVKITITQRQELRSKVKEASDELEDVKDCLLDTVMDQLSPRQVSVLIGECSADHDDRDDSFTLEWEGIFGRCFNIVNNLRLYLGKRSVGEVEIQQARTVRYKKNKSDSLAWKTERKQSII